MEQEQEDPLAYLEAALEQVSYSGLRELTFMHSLVGGLSAHVSDYEWRSCIDEALRTAQRPALKRP